jgi:hypothetical protein
VADGSKVEWSGTLYSYRSEVQVYIRRGSSKQDEALECYGRAANMYKVNQSSALDADDTVVFDA